MEYLEQLASEWYEYQGYFVHRDLWVGAESWKEREQHFQVKFDAGKRYLHRMFGAEPHVHIEQIALIVSGDEVPRHSIAGGRIVRLSDLFADILETLSHFDIAESLVPDQWPLIRTLQFVATYRERLVSVLAKTSEKSTGGSAVA